MVNLQENYYLKETREGKTMQKKMSPSEREQLEKLIEGKAKMTTKKAQELLSKPHVALAFELILEEAGLSDTALAKRVGEILNRKASKKSSQTAIDANALRALKMIWEMRGKFSKKTSGGDKGAIEGLSEKQLDTILAQGAPSYKPNKQGS